MDSDKWTDAELERLEKRIRDEYEKAQKELGEKAAKYFQEYEERFKREELAMLTSSLSKDEVESKWVDLYGNNAGFEKWFKGADHAYGENGTQAKQKFHLWEMAQLGRGQHWYDLRDQMAQRLTETNQIAAGYINDVLPKIYVASNNEVAKIAQDAAMEQGIMGVKFDLVDEYTVRNLMVESSDVRPYKPVNISIDESSKWSKNKLQNALLQGILQGDSIDHIADRFEAVTGMNRNAAVRNARTATTNAQSAGKQDRYNDLAKKGCIFTKIWKATADERTRPEHWEADGQEVDYDQTFNVGDEDLMYPGDPSASGWNRYNCRCTMRTGKPTFTSVLTNEYLEDSDKNADKSVYEMQMSLSDLGLVDKMDNIVNSIGNDAFTSLWNRVKDDILITELNAERSSINSTSRMIKINFVDTIAGSDKKMPYQSLFHEIGHYIDDYLAKPSEKMSFYSYEYKDHLFDKTIRQDFDNWVNQLNSEHSGESSFNAYDYINDLFGTFNRKQTSGFTDIICGASGGKITNRRGHSDEYYKKPETLSGEAFAQFTCSLLTNPDQLAYMQEYLPNSYEVYLEILESAAK